MMNVSRNWPKAVIGRIVGTGSPASPDGDGSSVRPKPDTADDGRSCPPSGGPVVHRLGNVDWYACGSGSVDGVTWNPDGASSCSCGARPRPNASPSVRRISSWMYDWSRNRTSAFVG